ncbi:hypothetical protein JQN09_05365 [Phocaeicola dorei]|nr:hypothetical protein [Phocaeicola dorei]RJV40276.1 hypothetical protein DWY42_16785 [Bacteroides sp. AF25-18]MBT1304592.1 hypothetical protein [Phocaeicola dorei]MBT1306633.1 hypothetical protein [Phocaeicola dorei]MBT1311370.1 hypothetical protein [Phocaeicola dorei]
MIDKYVLKYWYLFSKNEHLIGNNVWIDESARITSGIAIGDGGIIGTNAVMPHDVPSGRGGRDVGVCAREEG